MSMIGPVQSRCHEGSPVGESNLRWEGFVQKVGFELGLPPVPDYPGRPGFKTLCPASRMNPIRDANVPDFPQDIVHIVKLP